MTLDRPSKYWRGYSSIGNYYFSQEKITKWNILHGCPPKQCKENKITQAQGVARNVLEHLEAFEWFIDYKVIAIVECTSNYLNFESVVKILSVVEMNIFGITDFVQSYVILFQLQGPFVHKWDFKWLCMTMSGQRFFNACILINLSPKRKISANSN